MEFTINDLGKLCLVEYEGMVMQGMVMRNPLDGVLMLGCLGEGVVYGTQQPRDYQYHPLVLHQITESPLVVSPAVPMTPYSVDEYIGHCVKCQIETRMTSQ